MKIYKWLPVMQLAWTYIVQIIRAIVHTRSEPAKSIDEITSLERRQP